jgi:tripartite-type tricarboxylate transporter receptor subunit TctC
MTGSIRIVAALAALIAPGVVPASAQSYPNRPITLVIPLPPGGTNDIMARAVADKLSASLGQQIVVENRAAGGSGTVGTRQVAKAAPDGYTLLLGYTSTLATGPSMHANVGYDPRKDFAPIGLIAVAPSLLVPTIAESGLPGFDAVLSYGIVAPAGTPQPSIQRLNKDLRAALATDEVKKRLHQEGAEPAPTSPEEHAAVIDREETKWSTLIKSIGLKAE